MGWRGEPTMSTAISDNVASSLIGSLQSDCASLREENRTLQRGLLEAEQEAKTIKSRLELQEAELAHLKHELASKDSADLGAAAARSAVTVVHAGDELERELVSALTDALGDGASWEAAVGASRRRARKSPSSITAAAVRTAKRAQATWLTEHAALRDEAADARHHASARALELEEAHATIKRLRHELGLSKRGLQDVRARLQQAEERWLTISTEQTLEPLPIPRLARRTDENATSEFATYLEARRGAHCAHSQLAERLEGGAADGTDRPPPMPMDSTRLPRLKAAALDPTDSAPAPAPTSSAARSMSEALAKQWQQHVSHHSRGSRAIGLGGGRDRERRAKPRAY